MKKIVGATLLFLPCFLVALAYVEWKRAEGYDITQAVRTAVLVLAGLFFVALRNGSDFFVWCFETPRLPTAAQRILALIAIGGALVGLAGFLAFASVHERDLYYVGTWVPTLLWHTYADDWYYYAARAGLVVFAVFLFLAFGYRKTILPVLTWVRAGQ